MATAPIRRGPASAGQLPEGEATQVNDEMAAGAKQSSATPNPAAAEPTPPPQPGGPSKGEPSGVPPTAVQIPGTEHMAPPSATEPDFQGQPPDTTPDFKPQTDDEKVMFAPGENRAGASPGNVPSIPPPAELIDAAATLGPVVANDPNAPPQLKELFRIISDAAYNQTRA